MSTYIVDPDVVHKVVEAWLVVHPEFEGCRSIQIHVAEQLFAMNVEAVRQRYPDVVDANGRTRFHQTPGLIWDEHDTYETVFEHYKPTSFTVPKTHVWAEYHDAVQQLQYQCAEGDVPGTNPWYGVLYRLRNIAAKCLQRAA